MTAHHFYHHDAFVRFRGRVKAVESLGHNLYGGVEAEGVIGSGKVIVDGFWNTDDRISLLFIQSVGNTQSVFAADSDQVIQAKLLPIGLKLLNIVRLFKWISAGRPENRTPAGKDPSDGKGRERLDVPVDQTGPPIPNAQ